MSNHKNDQHKQGSSNYASRLLSRMLDDRKRPVPVAVVIESGGGSESGKVAMENAAKDERKSLAQIK